MTSHIETPFQISVSTEALEALQTHLSITRFPDELDDAEWDYGSPLADVQRLVARWKNGYDWRKYEKELNEKLPMFTMGVQVEGHGGLDVHYVHGRSKVMDAVPLLFVHGCEFCLCISHSLGDLVVKLNRMWTLDCRAREFHRSEEDIAPANGILPGPSKLSCRRYWASWIRVFRGSS